MDYLKVKKFVGFYFIHKIKNMKKIVFLIALFTGCCSAQDKKKRCKEDKKEEKPLLFNRIKNEQLKDCLQFIRTP